MFPKPYHIGNVYDLVDFAESQADIVSTESKCIAECETNVSLHCFVEGEIERLDVRVVCEMVYRGRNNAILDGKDCCDGFNTASSAKQVACH